MDLNIIEKIEEESDINLGWFYHSTYYNKDDYKNILKEGIKCNYLLNKSYIGKYNGPFYISLSKVTIPDNLCFIHYACSNNNPSFIIDGINPIECKNIAEYEKYIYTKDKRRMGNLTLEYQYYYLIETSYIKGILYNLYGYSLYYTKDKQEIYIKQLLELIDLLEELNIDIPIYDYSRKDKTFAHKIDKEKLKYYSKI